MQTKKIYGLPLVVARRVDEEVAKSNDKIFEIVLERMAIKMQQAEFRTEYGVNEDWHRLHGSPGLYSKGCGCAYCLAVQRYVSTKVSAHRLRRRIDDYDYMCRPYENPMGTEHLHMLEQEWPKLRELSHQLKAQLGL